MTIKNTMRHDDREPYFVGPDWNKVKVIGSKRAAKISYERGCTAIDCEGTRYNSKLECGTWGRPVLEREDGIID